MNESIVEQLTKNKRVESSKAQSANDDNEYKAYHFHSKDRLSRLDIRYKNDKADSIYYPHISRIQRISDKTITIIFQASAFVIKGKNLKKLYEHLQEEKVRFIQEYDNNKNYSGTQSSEEAIIESIIEEVSGAEEEE